MIDQPSRNRLVEENKTKILVNGMKDAIITAIGGKSSNNNGEEVLKLVVKREDDEKTYSMLDKIGKGMAMMYSKMGKPIALPKIFTVQGKVKADIESLPPVKINNLSELRSYFDELSRQVSSLAQAVSSIPPAKIEFPKLDLPKSDNKELIAAINGLKQGKGKSSLDNDVVDALFPIREAIEALRDKPGYVPTPVTHMSINGLQGQYLATLITVTSSGTALPSNQMANRRSLIVYNSSSQTIFVGGAGVRASGVNQGFPVNPSTSSPSFDAGQNMILYGVTASGNANVNILEMSEEASGR